MTRSSTFLAALWCSISMLACTNSGPDLGDDDDVTADFEIQVELTELVPTVARVTWSMESAAVEAASVWFAAGEAEERQVEVDLSAGAPCETLLVGLKPDQEVRVRVEALADGDTLTSAEVVVTTGAVPASLPSTSVEWTDPESAHRGYIVTSVFAPVTAVVVFDSDGDYVWWLIPEQDGQISRATLARDGESLLYWSLNIQSGPGPGPGGDKDEVTQALVRVGFDGEEIERFELPDGHHDLVELPAEGGTEGVFGFLEYDVREMDGESKEGDRLVELLPDGTTQDVYCAWDDIEDDPDSPGQAGVAWSHGNALDYVAEEDAYYVSFLGFGGIFRIDRNSGERDWILGGTHSTFATAGGETELFQHQHQFQRLDDSILVFDNGTPVRNYSQAVEYTLDTGQGLADLAWSYRPEPDIFSFSLGDVRRFDDGNTLVVFSTGGQLDEVNQEGDLLWRLTLGLGGAVGYTTWVDDLMPGSS